MSDRPSVGDWLLDSVSEARFVVIEPGAAVAMPSLNGVALLHGRPQPCSAVAQARPDCEVQGGQRYVDPVTGLTLLCVWPGSGSISYDGRTLTTVGVLPRSGLNNAEMSKPKSIGEHHPGAV